jgi:hypothetical protein
MRFNQVSELHQVLAALSGAHPRPGTFFESFARRLDRVIHVSQTGFSHANQNLLRGRVDGFKGLARLGRLPFR